MANRVPKASSAAFGLVRTRALRNRRIEHHRKVLRPTESAVCLATLVLGSGYSLESV